MSRETVLASVAVLLMSTGCGDGGNSTDLTGTAFTTVANTEPTLWEADSPAWRLVEERVVIPETNTPGEIGRSMGIVADQAGNVYVMQREPPVIKVFGPDGGWLRNIGLDGDGPGEFRRSMIGIRHDTLVVQDIGNTRLSLFSTEGEFLGSAISQCCFRNMQPIPIFEDGRAVITGPAADPELSDRSLYLTRLDGTVSDTLTEPRTRSEGDNLWSATRDVGGGAATRAIRIPNQPRNVDKWRSDGLRVRGNTSSYALFLTNTTGDTLTRITAEAPSLQLTPAERDSMFEEAILDVTLDWQDAIRAEANRSDIPRDRHVWSDFGVDDENRLWVGRPGPGGDAGILDVFDAEGVLLGSLSSPSPNFLAGYWVDGRVYVADVGEDGFMIIRVYRLETD